MIKQVCDHYCFNPAGINLSFCKSGSCTACFWKQQPHHVQLQSWSYSTVPTNVPRVALHFIEQVWDPWCCQWQWCTVGDTETLFFLSEFVGSLYQLPRSLCLILGVGTWEWFQKATLLKFKVSISKSDSNWTAELILQDFMVKKKIIAEKCFHCLSQIDSFYLLVSGLSERF